MSGAAPSRTISHQHVYRIDKFKVPSPARREFLEKTRDSQSFLRRLPGFVRDAIFEQASGPGTFNFVTVVEWESDAAVEAAEKAVGAMYEESGFHLREFLSLVGIEADMGFYFQHVEETR